MALDCSARGLAGLHDLEPLSGAELDGATGVYVQGFGMEGPSGCIPLSEEAPPSYGLTALYRETGALLAYAEDHSRCTCVFRTAQTPTLSGPRQTVSGGFNLEGTAGEAVALPTLYFEDAAELSGGLRTCAERIAARMGARDRMPPVLFWSSWYHAYETMDLAYLETVFRTLRDWGFTFFKTDFMLWSIHDSSTVRRHTPGLTSVELMRRVLRVIRGAIGEDSYLLGCIAPFLPFLGYADGMRIAGDGGARWAEPYGPINLLWELPCDNYFNHVFWQNGPDAMLLRDFDTYLKNERKERGT